jgi:inorganic pyrophosphatase
LVSQPTTRTFISKFANNPSTFACRTFASQTKKQAINKMANTPQQSFSSYQVGQPDTLEYRVFFKGSSGPISPFHDIPLWADKNHKIANMVVEIPKGTQPKLEINKDEFMNPIKQDVKNGKLRIVALKYPFNYGAFPQTWENPSVVHPDTKAKGDNDPVDVVEISSSVFKTGEVRQVKILGTYAMIDEGETDWKVLVIDVNDPLASQLNDAADIDKVMPGKTKEVFEFLRDYKIPDGKPANQFAFDSALQNRAFALNIVDETHHEWSNLIHGKTGSKISIANVAVEGSPQKISSEEATAKLKH